MRVVPPLTHASCGASVPRRTPYGAAPLLCTRPIRVHRRARAPRLSRVHPQPRMHIRPRSRTGLPTHPVHIYATPSHPCLPPSDAAARRSRVEGGSAHSPAYA
ncbi:hypothetical protein GCM10018793_29810 [Streptomyces sulfonofaciens]|uniref:Uncharacterized protein n=1 Tax=Streptomyces sulfonofaciens TaxID=68272 RepID=A0A919L0Y6_9ACTN|nr:hypothetical protein GCM10018793_29810 [Streptomyces sulfonofaciens]